MKIKIRLQNKVPLGEFFFFVALFCVVTYALLEHMSVSIPMFSVVKMPLMYLGGICLIARIGPRLKALKKKRYFHVMLLVLLFVIFLELTCVFYTGGRGMGGSPQGRTTRLILYLLELFFVMIWAAQSGRSQYVLNFLFYYLFAVAVINDLLMFANLFSFGGSKGHYLIGTKFTVSYLHLNLITFWYIRSRQQNYSRKKARRVVLFGMPVVLLVCLYVNCVTGVLGSILLLVMFSFLHTQKRGNVLKLKSPVTLLLALTASVVFPFLAEQIVKMPVVLQFIENVAGREADLTGRVNIFTAFIEEMEHHWMWGFGFGNANAAAVQLFGYANAQNALLQWVFQVGIPTTAIMVLLMLAIFWRLSKSSNTEICMPVVLLIYLYIFIGMIEITFSMSFLLWFGLIFMLINDRGVPAPIASETEEYNAAKE